MTVVGGLVAETKEGQSIRIWAVKSQTKTGVVHLLRLEDGATIESTTTKGFAEALQTGKLEGWRLLNTAAVDKAITPLVMQALMAETATAATE